MQSLITTLAELVDWDQGAPESIQCAYKKDVQSRCGRRMAKGNLSDARIHFASHLEIITSASGGYTKASPQFQTLQSLAKIYICGLHWKTHGSQAEEQWLEELNLPGDLKRLKLEEDASGSSDTQPEGRKHTELIYQYHGPARTPDEEENFFREDEGVSSLSGESTPPTIRAIRRTVTMDEVAVARNVTWLLKQPLDDGLALVPGYIYVVCPPGLPGIFKVGFTVQHPKLSRLVKHNNCYGEVDLIKRTYTQYAYRVEQLLLAEFSNNHYQLEVPCQKCDHSHRELLAVDKDTLLESLEKWVEFIALPAYDTSGLLLAEAQSEIPLPASKEFLICRRPKRKSNAMKRRESQDSQPSPAPAPPLNYEAATSIKKYTEVQEVEVNIDELCAEVADVYLTPSKPANRRRSRQGCA